ncbi:hypothetical protein Pyn_08306 [Prunus yedoensis var. nudiflora]|uniref:Uncharacterized protein n=1 Tax=Prunus yedoensis var. nudiflora TaxID=2094558 RepID=A0A314XPA8_PRUYE|nr:hypothetical protein Pyn_08306 [Prunus yedoensis var. nudiflora]
MGLGLGRTGQDSDSDLSPLLFGTLIEVELLGICGASPRFSLSPIKGRSFNFTLHCVNVNTLETHHQFWD